MTRIVYIGNFGAAPYTTENHLARSFRALGCEVVEMQQEDAAAMGPRSFLEFARARDADLVLYTRTHNRTALGQARRRDVEEWNATWTALGPLGIVTASFHLDRFWHLEREHLIHGHDPLFTTAHVFTADGGNQDRFAAAGVNHHWLPPGIVADECRRYDPDPEFPYDVVFVGSGGTTYHREYPQRGELLAFLAARYGDRFARFGHGALPNVRGEDLGTVYASATVVVGDSCFANEPWSPRSAKYVSDRIPETLGRGGVLVHAHVAGITDGDYLPGLHLMTHEPGDWDALAQQVDWLLDNPDAADGMRTLAQARVANGHTYSHRVAELLSVVGLRDPAAVV